MKAPSYIEVGPKTRTPGAGLTVTVTLVIDTPVKAVLFAWDMAREVASWWHRPAVFLGLLAWGAQHLMTRSSP